MLVSADTDFGTVLAETGWPGPSLVLFRRTSGIPSIEFGSLSTCLRLEEVREALQRGPIVVIEPSRVRIRALPIGGAERNPLENRFSPPHLGGGGHHTNPSRLFF